MSVIKTVTLVKSGATFVDVDDAMTTFNTDNASTELTNATSDISEAVSAGTLTVTAELTADADGVVLTRTWDDAAFEAAGGEEADPIALVAGWTRTTV